MQTKTLKSDLLLLVAAFLWGTTFVAQRRAMEHLGPMMFNAVGSPSARRRSSR